MSLTTGRGPLGHNPAGRLVQSKQAGSVYVEPFLRRVRARIDGREVIDSQRVLLVHRAGMPPTYAFPATDVADGVRAAPEEAAPGYVRVPWDAVTAWFEEEEQVLALRNPYHRVDCVPCRRHLRVELDGAVLVDTTEVVGLYETSRAPDLYVSQAYVRMDLLAPSSTRTYCPYKGHASYWSATIEGRVFRDVAWSYDEPRPECAAVAGFLSFDAARTTVTKDLPDWFEVPASADVRHG